MLNKDICEKCWGIGWTPPDEEDWVKLRQVSCIHCPEKELHFRYISIDKPPPPDCPYKLEHAVSEVMKDAK